MVSAEVVNRGLNRVFYNYQFYKKYIYFHILMFFLTTNSFMLYFNVDLIAVIVAEVVVVSYTFLDFLL